ncbi:MAG: Ig-like domain-containing protein, partial [Aureliella sp.]
MAANPVANDDAAYYTTINTDLVVALASNPGPLLANDIDIDGGALTSSVVASPTSGTLIAFGTNGTFTYRPNNSFQGIDTFTYKVNDGTLDGNTATVSIAVGTKLLAKQNLDNNIVDSDSGGLLTTGGLKLSEAITPDQALVYRSDSLAKPIIAVETQLAPGVAVPTAITAQLTFNGVAGTTYSYSMSGIVAGQPMRFALQADGTALATGMYNYSVSVGTTISGTTTYQTFTGQQAIVNRATSEYGANWWLSGLDRVYDSAAGALLVQGDGDTLWFKKSGSTYLHADGDTSYGTFVKSGSTYTLTAKTGELSNFSALGLLTSRVDTNANTVSFAYADRNSDGIANELITITDPFGRVTNVNYTSSKVSSVAHFSGRTTTLTISSGNLTGYTLTDPDGAGPLAAPAFAFAYASAGKISSRTDAVSYTTSYSFNATDGRLRTLTHPDTKTWQLIPSETVGLP